MTSLLWYPGNGETLQGVNWSVVTKDLGEWNVEFVKHREFFRVVKSFNNTVIVHNDTMHAKTLGTSQQHRWKHKCLQNHSGH